LKFASKLVLNDDDWPPAQTEVLFDYCSGDISNLLGLAFYSSTLLLVPLGMTVFLRTLANLLGYYSLTGYGSISSFGLGSSPENLSLRILSKYSNSSGLLNVD